MVNWVRASYSDNQVQDKIAMTTLEYVTTVGRYNIYSCDNGMNIVIFSDQMSLLDFVESHLGSVFLIRLLLPSNNKYKYTVKIGDYTEDVFTLAKAAVAVEGTAEHPRKLIYSATEGLVVVE